MDSSITKAGPHTHVLCNDGSQYEKSLKRGILNTTERRHPIAATGLKALLSSMQDLVHRNGDATEGAVVRRKARFCVWEGDIMMRRSCDGKDEEPG